ncbi:MAG: hypothetical protein JWP74_1941 [Marmoricola sp.]|nr:hypothetical protein [Marmoricola sp.]
MTGRVIEPGLLPVPARSAVFTAAGIGASATVLVAVLDPGESGHYPTCPLLAVTGLYCPFCGGLRAVHDLTHLDLGAAMARNPLAVVVLPFLLLLCARWALPAFTGRPNRRIPLPRWTGWAGLAVLLVYAVLRNLPGWTWLSPA